VSAYGSCRSCSAAIIWALTEARKRMPLDRQPDPDGSLLAYCDELGGWHCRAYVPGETVRAPWKRFTSHFATCPHADEHRAPKNADGQRAAAQEVSSFLAEYRQARSANEAAKRNRRGRRKPAQTCLGYRRNP